MPTATPATKATCKAHGFSPYPIAYKSIVPKRGECDNLLVPVCVSATHIAYGSIRMEPVFMVLGQSAATAACQAIDTGAACKRSIWAGCASGCWPMGKCWSGPARAAARELNPTACPAL